jgi:hypothetical protein
MKGAANDVKRKAPTCFTDLTCHSTTDTSTLAPPPAAATNALFDSCGPRGQAAAAGAWQHHALDGGPPGRVARQSGASARSRWPACVGQCKADADLKSPGRCPHNQHGAQPAAGVTVPRSGAVGITETLTKSGLWRVSRKWRKALGTVAPGTSPGPELPRTDAGTPRGCVSAPAAGSVT